MAVTCLHPITLKNKYTHENISVPCGKCEACKSMRANRWVSRINQEMKFSSFNIFFTLTYSDEFLPLIDLSDITADEWKILVEDTQSYECFKYYKYYLPYARKRDLQLFIKRLRQQIYRCKEIPEPEKVLRYYAVSEFGPTTFRPHFHGILFFESEYFFNHAYDFILKAWSTLDKHSNERTPFGRVDVQSVEGQAASYVASYLNCITDLPKILQTKDFKPFSTFSVRPPIGSHSLSRASLQAIFNGETTGFTIEKPDTYEVCSIPLWRTFEATWFPKCIGYYSLSTRGRFALYGLSSLFENFSQLVEFIRSEWSELLSACIESETLYSSIKQAFRLEEYKDVNLDNGLPKCLTDSLLRQYRISCRVRLIRSKMKLSLSKYLVSLETYYKNKEYQLLLAQLQFEKLCVDDSPLNLPYLLSYIDNLFYENKNQISSYARDLYLEQFGVSLIDMPKYLYLDSPLFKKTHAKMLEYLRVGRSKKLRNEYLENHPELLKLHLF